MLNILLLIEQAKSLFENGFDSSHLIKHAYRELPKNNILEDGIYQLSSFFMHIQSYNKIKRDKLKDQPKNVHRNNIVNLFKDRINETKIS